jgi:hypothetical protein
MSEHSLNSSFPDAQMRILDARSAGPESITTIVIMDSGLAPLARPGMTMVEGASP